MASQSALKKRLKALLNQPQNHVCADCPERQPRWASLIKAPPGAPPGSLPVGAFICLECSGSHRRLGVHISFVRSISLDSWKESEVEAMEKGGNKKVNAIFEARLGGASKPTTGASGQVRERFIRNKYERRKYFDAGALDQVYGDSANDSNSDDSSSEEEVVTRAPSNVARLRAQQRARNVNIKPTIAAIPKRRTAKTAPPPPAAPPPQPEVLDLLDFTTPIAATSTPALTVTQTPPPPSHPPSAAPVSNPSAKSTNGHISSPSHTMARTNDSNGSKDKMSSKDILAMFNTPNMNMMPSAGNNINPMTQHNNNLNMMQQTNNMNMMQPGIMPNNNMNMMMQQQQNQQQMMMMMMMQKNMMQQQNNARSSQIVQGMQNLNMNSINNSNMAGLQNNNMMQGMHNNMMQGMQFKNMSVSSSEQSTMMQGRTANTNMSTNNTSALNNMSNQMPMGGTSNLMMMGGMPNPGTYNPMVGMQHMNQQHQYGGQNNSTGSQNTHNNSQQSNTQFGGMGF